MVGSILVGGRWGGPVPSLWLVDKDHIVISPIHALLAIRIVNLEPVQAELASFSFDIHGNGEWIPLLYVDHSDCDLFVGAIDNQHSFTNAWGATVVQRTFQPYMLGN